tara:strand:+ start:44397 stop:44585 length:189 start_codon:yes stop_codon:yes gene_type:complete
MEWLTISITPPETDCVLAARTADKFGLGATHALFEFDSNIFTQENVEEHFTGTDYIEWVKLS